MRIATSENGDDVAVAKISMEAATEGESPTSPLNTEPDKVGSKNKKSKSKGIEQKMIRHIGEDPARLIAEINPGKKGGDYELPFGGKLSVPAGLLGKKDVVTCCMMSPSDRYKYLPPIRKNEYLLSEVFLLATSLKSMKGSMGLKLPYYEENTALFDIDLMWKNVDSEEWSLKEFELARKGRFVQFEVDSGGIFVVISKPKCETFDIPVQGCLYNSKLSHQLSVRFPKKATSIDLLCNIVSREQSVRVGFGGIATMHRHKGAVPPMPTVPDFEISPVNRENLPNLYREYPRDMEDLVVLSDYAHIQTNIPTTFKRAATVKLPLPSLESEHFQEEDMAVLHFTEDGWQLLDTPLKFTKSAVMFDTKTLSKYCVALSKPKRKRRLVNALIHLQEEQDSTRGQVLSFLHVQEKLWTLWVEVCKYEDATKCVEKREEQGFRKIQAANLPVIEEKVPFRRNWKNKKIEPLIAQPKRDGVDLVEGQVIQFDLTGDIWLCSDSSANKFMGMYYHDRLKENYKRLFVEPRNNPEEVFEDITGKLMIYTGDQSQKESKCIASFDVSALAREVESYFYVRPLTPEPEPEVEPEVMAEEAPATPRIITTRPPTASFLRLITPIKPPRKAQKESKVLSGKSLMCLAREIEQGLTLAIHLDISDSTITGMGFDALANGLSLRDITYRILLMWKRKTNKFKDRQLDLLISALQEMGRNDVATIVVDSHKNNKELTPAAFEMPMFNSAHIMTDLPSNISQVIS